MEYDVVLATDLEELRTQVRELISAGWRPQGGISMSVNEDSEEWSFYYAQAMVRGGPGW